MTTLLQHTSMPEVAVDEDDQPCSSENEVGSPAEVFPAGSCSVKALSQPSTRELPSEQTLHARISASYCRHDARRYGRITCGVGPSGPTQSAPSAATHSSPAAERRPACPARASVRRRR